MAAERGPNMSSADMSRLRESIAPDDDVPTADLIDWKIIAASRCPGPGAYTIKDEVADRLRGGRFSKGNSKSEVEWIAYEASQKPGPADYRMPDVSDLMTGGRLNKGKAKGFLDWVEYTSKQIPAPHDHQPEGYDSSTRSPIPGGAFNEGISKSGLDWEIHRASQVPDPQCYDTRKSHDYLLNQPESWRGKFPTGISKSSIDWAQYYGAQIPGAADYDVKRSVNYLRTDGFADAHCGRFGKSISKTFVDWECHLHGWKPAPHDYDLNKSWDYLDGKSGPVHMMAGARIMGRPTPAQMPFPFEQWGSGDKSGKIGMGPSESHNQSLTPWRESDFSKMGSRPKTSPSDGRPTPGLSSIELDRSPSADHALAQRPWAENPNYSRTKPGPTRTEDEIALREMRKRACRSAGAGGRSGDADELSLSLEASILNNSMTGGGDDSHWSHNPAHSRRTKARGGRASAAKKRQDKMRQARQRAAIAASSQSNQSLRSGDDGKVSLRLSYKAEVNVDQVVRIKGPEATSNGYDIHVWVRDGRQTKHHTVSTRTADEAQQWVDGVQAAKGRATMELSLGNKSLGIGDMSDIGGPNMSAESNQ